MLLCSAILKSTGQLCESEISTISLVVHPVRVYNDDQMHFVNTAAFFDGGSNISLCTTNLMQRLNLRGPKVTRKTEGVTGSYVWTC